MGFQSDIVIKDGQEFVETDYALLGLGLQVPDERVAKFPTLLTKMPLLSEAEIKNIIGSEDFKFGRHYFDSSYTTYQNGYGSCAGYGGASARAKSIELVTGERRDLSGDYLYSLVNGGRDRGSMLDDNMEALMKFGCCRRDLVKLGEIYRNKYDTDKADKDAALNRGHELYATPDEQSVATALAMRIPVVIAIHVTNAWRRFDSDDVLAPCNGPGNHCEHLDDIKWDNRRGCFLFRKATSHGKDYSGDGYCWTTWKDHYAVSSRYHMFYAVPGGVSSDLIPQIEEKEKDNLTISLVMESKSNCSWCKKFKTEDMGRLQQLGWKVEEVSGFGTVPTFTLTVGGTSKKFVGYKSADSLIEASRELLS